MRLPMNKFSSIFGQILQIFSKGEYYGAVVDTETERKAKGFTCRQQFVAMMFCQIGQAHSLREICGGSVSCMGKLKHLGVHQAPLYQKIFYQLLGKCHTLTVGRKRFRIIPWTYFIWWDIPGTTFLAILAMIHAQSSSVSIT